MWLARKGTAETCRGGPHTGQVICGRQRLWKGSKTNPRLFLNLLASSCLLIPGGMSSTVSASQNAGEGSGDIRSIIAQKERELRDINDYRIQTLEAVLADKVC